MYSSDDDFMARLSCHIHATPNDLVDKGDLVLNPDVRNFYTGFRDAAVLFSLIRREEGLTSLFNMRPMHLKDHGGQIGFPGGKIEPEDESIAGAAIREAWEEVGIAGHRIEPLGFLDAYVTGSGFRVVPVMATIETPFEMNLDCNEVEEAFEVPISFLMDPANHTHGYITYKQKDRFYYEMNYETHGRTWRIWGVTAGIVRLLYETLYPEFPVERPYLREHSPQEHAHG